MYRLDDISIVHDGVITIGYGCIIWHYDREFSKRDLGYQRALTVVDLDTNEKQNVTLQHFCTLLKNGEIFCQSDVDDNRITAPVISDLGYQLSRNLEFVGFSKSFEEVNIEILSSEFSSDDIKHLAKMIRNSLCYNYVVNYKLGIFDCIASGNMPHEDSIICRHGYVIDSDEELVSCNIYDFMIKEKRNVLFLSDGTIGVVTLCVNAPVGDLCVVKFKYKSKILMEFM